ncbi:MAG: Panacea domain-containing protein [Proteobacteria bacterium]|nr:Panacea domain-containing protein [Pseudomonadota bacterium]
MKISIPKLKAMMRYFATFTDPQLLGKKKLMKLFYFSDFTHVKNYASPITYDNYVHLEHGPIPSTIMNLVSAVENDPDNSLLSDSISVITRDGSYLKQIVTSSKFSDRDSEYFSKSELRILKDVCARFKDKNGKFIEEASHRDSAWSETEELENIPYILAVGDDDCKVTEEDIKFAVEAFNK